MIGKNISALRRKHKLTQNEFAERVHVTQGAVSQWETGRTNPDTYQLIQIADIFGVDVNTLTKGEEQSAVTFPGKVVTVGDLTYRMPETPEIRSHIIDYGSSVSEITKQNAAAIRSALDNELDTALDRLTLEQKRQALAYIKFLETQRE